MPKKNEHRIDPGTPVKLARIDTDGKELHDNREAAEAEFKLLREEFIEWQPRFYAEGKRKLLIVFQAMDAGGKDGTIRDIFRGTNPQGISVTSFKAPTSHELSRDFLWRIHQAVPAKGMIGVFNRSHFEDVLVVRVDKIVPESVWRPRYEFINDFEKLLTSTGTTILKFYLHISQKEQQDRFQERQKDPAKQWKFSADDLAKSKNWDAYRAAYDEMLEKCSTDHAPWYVIPADQNWYRNLAIMRIIWGTCQALNPQYPKVT